MQNTNILQKCVEELKKESPNISYILGMLETVIAMSGTQTQITNFPSSVTPLYVGSAIGTGTVSGSGLVSELSPEEILAQKYVGGPIGNLQ